MDLLSSNTPLSLIPAELSFLAIYNPTFGVTDETFQDQIFFYHSKKSRSSDGQSQPDHGHEKERQIGLAQGMINFAKGFADENVNHIDTEKTRVVTKELEPNWWIVASINLTKIPIATSRSEIYVGPGDGYECSARDISPPSLLTSQLVSAYRTFLLHNGTSLTKLLNHLERTRFCSLLDRFWSRFANRWNIMLEGIPIGDLFNGIKLAAGGELGIGVGEEEWGSGEREVLEDFTSRTPGLVDVIVARFGDPPPPEPAKEDPNTILEPWMGSGRLLDASDGILFSGTGELTRASIRDIFEWMRWIYAYGEAAYAVRDSPSSDRRKRRKRDAKTQPQATAVQKSDVKAHEPGIPKSILGGKAKSSTTTESKQDSKAPVPQRGDSKSPPVAAEQESWTKYLKFGYGTLWALPDVEIPGFSSDTTKIPVDAIKTKIRHLIAQENAGFFLIGLRGDPEDESDEMADDAGGMSGWNHRLMIRTIHVVTTKTPSSSQHSGSTKTSSPSPAEPPRSPSITGPPQLERKPSAERSTRLRTIVYVHRPFIYTLLFDPAAATISLDMPPLYRSMHTFLSSLHPLLERRTGPSIARKRLASAGPGLFPPQVVGREGMWAAVCDLASKSVWSTLPAIPPPPSSVPDTGMLLGGSHLATAMWSRGDALAAYMVALDVMSSVGKDERERSVKTAKGWWVVWARQYSDFIGEQQQQQQQGEDDGNGSDRKNYTAPGSKVTARSIATEKQIIIIKKPQPGESNRALRLSSGWGLSVTSRDAHADSSSKIDASKLGIGFDPRRYMEGIVRLGR